MQRDHVTTLPRYHVTTRLGTAGDGTVIEGLELAILGSGDIKPMQPGGIRRVMVPQILGYGNAARSERPCL